MSPDDRGSTTDRESAEHLAALVACLIEDDLVAVDDWVAWAAHELLVRDEASAWLAELATTYVKSEALHILAAVGGVPSAEERLGVLHLSFEGNLMDSFELLDLGLSIAGGFDTGGGFVPHQRELMKLFRRVEAGRASQDGCGADDLAAVKQDIVAFFEPLGTRVRVRVSSRIAVHTGRETRGPGPRRW